jgi:hypothetical protein
VRLLEERAVSVEKIPIRSVVRDVLQLPAGGPLLLWDGRGVVRVLRPADHVFSQCAACHGMRDGQQHGIGPDLFGVVGSPVGRHGNYDYSAALRQYGGTWTPARLGRFLEDPQHGSRGTCRDRPVSQGDKTVLAGDGRSGALPLRLLECGRERPSSPNGIGRPKGLVSI